MGYGFDMKVTTSEHILRECIFRCHQYYVSTLKIIASIVKRGMYIVYSQYGVAYIQTVHQIP